MKILQILLTEDSAFTTDSILLALKRDGLAVDHVQICSAAELSMRETEARLAAEKALLDREEVLASLSHDIKNPLGCIKLNIQLLQRELGAAEATDIKKKALDQLLRIDHSTERIILLVSEVLDKQY